MLSSARTGVLGLTAILLAMTQACATKTPAGQPAEVVSSAPTPELSAVPSPSVVTGPPSRSPSAAPSPAGDVLSGKRQLYVLPLDDGHAVPGSIVSVTSAGRASITGDFGDRALFVPVPTRPGGDGFLLKTGKLRSGGAALCLMVKDNGSDPLTLATRACDAGEKDQTFTFTAEGKDGRGGTVWLIGVAELYLHWTPGGRYGLIVQESGEGDDLTHWVLVDRGPAGLPTPG
jgi:hypothetical protein